MALLPFVNKHSLNNYLLKKAKLTVITFGILISVVLTSCSTTLRFLNSSVVPAATGSVKVSRDDNRNYAINIKVLNLAEPRRLQPKKEVYVAWLITKDNITKNIGQLNSSSGFFSNALEGKLVTVSPFKPDHIFLTAENNSNVQYPEGTVVLTTKSH